MLQSDPCFDPTWDLPPGNEQVLFTKLDFCWRRQWPSAGRVGRVSDESSSQDLQKPGAADEGYEVSGEPRTVLQNIEITIIILKDSSRRRYWELLVLKPAPLFK